MDITGEYWTTKELRSQGVSGHQIERACREGRLFRVARGLYMRGEPEGMGFLRALHHRFPRLVFAGHSASSVYGARSGVLRPAEVIVPKGHRLPESRFVEARQSRRADALEVGGLPVVSAVAAVAGDTLLNRVARIRFLEDHYSGFDGRERFDADRALLSPQLDEQLEPLLGKSVIGASSRMERFFHLELRARGINAIPNFRLGPYHWDVGIEDGTVVVDIDSLIHHSESSTRTFILDRWKANHAEMCGWGHLQFTDLCLQDPVAKRTAIEEIGRLVAYRRHAASAIPVPGRVEVGAWEIHDSLRHR